MAFLKIVLLTVAAAIVYGIAHDMVTTRVCVEYFTIGHPPVFNTTSPTLLALGWGVIATWWFGLSLGLPLALCAQSGGWPKLTARQLLKPLAVLLVIIAAVSLAAGLTGFLLARAGWVWLVEPLASAVPPDRHIPFLADLWAHNTAYLAGFVGAVVLCVWVWIRRKALITS